MRLKVTIDKKMPFPLCNTPTYIKGEILWSYVSRLAFSNGIFDTLRFLQLITGCLSDRNWKNYAYWPYSLNKAPIANMIHIEETDNIILETTLYSYLLPFMSRIYQAELIRNYETEILRDSARVIPQQISIIRTMKICPECVKHDIENGNFHYHKIHQFPDVKTCPIHGCNLKEFTGDKGSEFISDSFVELTCSEEDKAIAIFFKDLMENPIDCSSEDTIAVLKDKIYTEYSTTSYAKLKKLLSVDTWFMQHEEILKNTLLLLRKKHTELMNIRSTVLLILHLYDDWNSFRENITPTGISKELFAIIVSKDFTLIGNYRNCLIKVKCNKCGSIFNTTPLSIKAGIGCPNCTKFDTQAELFMSMFNNVSKGRYELLSDFKSMGSRKIRIKDLDTGIVYRVLPRYFIFYGECGLPEPEYITFDNLRKKIASLGHYELLETSGKGKTSMLLIKHLDCGHTFWISRSAFLREQYCRICCKDKVIAYPDYEAIITQESNGRFHWTGDAKKKIFKASDGTEEISSSGIGNLITRIKFKIDRNGRKKDLKPLKKAIIAFFVSNKNKVFFLEDMIFPYDRKAISRLVSSYQTAGKIIRYSKGVYYNANEHHSTEEILTAKYFNRYGRIVGVPIGDTLLRFIETGMISTENPMFAVFDNGCHKVRKLSHYINGITVKVYFTANKPLQDNWKKSALLETISNTESTKDWDDKNRLTLTQWIKSVHITFDTEDENDYGKESISKALNLFKGDLEHGA